MDGIGISDLSRSYTMRTLNADLNRALLRLSEEVVTGRAADTTLRLDAQFSFLAQIETDLVQSQARSVALTEVALIAGAQQTALGRLVDAAHDLFGTLAITQTDGSAISTSAMAAQARGQLDAIVSALNTNQGGRYAFSGTQVDAPPLVPSDQLLADFTAALTGASNEADVRAAADAFFDAPGGGFEASIYQGTAESLQPFDLGSGESVALNLRADDPALRDILKSVAILAVADDPALSLSQDVRREVITGQTDDLLNAQNGVLDLRAQLGFAEERIERATTRLGAERASLELARSDLIDVDPFETASTLEAVRLQLETLYSVTARTQNLSLVNFL